MPHAPAAGIILAAGKGTRMKSDLPKGLHLVCGLPMVEHVGRAMKAAGIESPIVVVGHGGDLIREALGDSYRYVWQREQKGTGHAALMAAELLESFDGPVLVAPGDAPLLEGRHFAALLDAHHSAEALATVGSVEMSDPEGYGRIVRTDAGAFDSIVEERDASPAQRSIREINAGIYAFCSKALFEALPEIGEANAQGEQYLTDALSSIRAKAGRVEVLVLDDAVACLGVNDRWQLAEAERLLRRRILRHHALNGVTIRDPDTTFVHPDADIAPDAILEPCTTIGGRTSIGARCRVGPYAIVDDSEIGDDSMVYMSRLSLARVGRKVKVGPFANLRPGCVLEDEVKIGNFVEVKNAVMGQGSAASHLAYLGDAQVGAGTNIGAGTITCNYDGFQKHRTDIGDGVFVGSNSTLVAPITIGDGAFIAAGSVVTHDVPGDALALGRARQEVKLGWAALWRNRKRGSNR